MKSTVASAVFLALTLAAGSARALPEFAIGGTVGTTGLGGQITANVLPFINLRGQIQGFAIDQNFNEDGIDYDAKLKLFNYGAYVDFYPLTRGFRLSAGVLGNQNRLDLDATCPNTCEVGGFQVTGQDARIDGRLDFRKVAPYAGIGFSNPLKGLPLYVGFDLGVIFQGSPRVALDGSGTATVTDENGLTRQDVDLANDPEFQQELGNEEQNLENETEDFKFYPVVQLNVGWRF